MPARRSIKTALKTFRIAASAIKTQMVEEQATGCVERIPEGGQLYDDNEVAISDTKARQLFRQGETVEVPNAGAGSYHAILARLGYTAVDVEDQTSSAGDWVFRVRSGLVFQSNRYPHYGFRYSYQRDNNLRDIS